MKNDTPRTDLNCLTVETLRTMKGKGTKIVLAAVCRQLERELSAANAKIKELTFGWAADREELRVARERIAELERIGTNLWRVASGFRIDDLYDEGMDEIPIEEADPECVVYEYDHGDGIQAKHVIELNKALDAWNEMKP